MSSKQPNKTSGKDRSGKAVKSGPAAEPFVSQVCYIKKSTSAFQLRLSDISLREENSWKSHDINWKIPGFDVGASQESGATHEIYDTEVDIENVTASTILFRIQKPMGFKDDPAALAMWEPVVQGKGGKETLLVEVRPHSHRTFRFKNHESGSLCPRQSMFQGSVAVHLYSIVPFREPMSDAGVAPAGTARSVVDGSIAVIVTTTVSFKTNDADSGTTKDDFVIETFGGSNRLDETTPGPAVPIRLCDLHVPGGNVSSGGIFRASFPGAGGVKQYWGLGFYSKGVSPPAGDSTFSDVDNLDKDTIYQLPYPVPCKSAVEPSKVVWAAYVKWHPFSQEKEWPDESWVVGAFTEPNKGSTQIGGFQFLRPVDNQASMLYPPSIRLTPVAGPATLLVKATRGRIKALKIANPSLHRALQVNKATSRTYEDLKNLDASVGETLLNALTVITKVVTVAIEIASIFGFAAVPLPNTARTPALEYWFDVGC